MKANRCLGRLRKCLKHLKNFPEQQSAEILKAQKMVWSSVLVMTVYVMVLQLRKNVCNFFLISGTVTYCKADDVIFFSFIIFQE